MTGGQRVPATRANLLRARRRGERVDRGVELLKRKREALVRELLGIAPSAVDARSRVAERAREAYPLLLDALALDGSDELRAMGWPLRDLRVRVRRFRIWGVESEELEEAGPVVRTLEARATAPPLTGPSAASAATGFERLVEVLLGGASREILLRRLGEALSRTSRQVHALEHRVRPRLDERIRTIQRTLDEREREDHFRLKRHLGKGSPGPGRPGGARGSRLPSGPSSVRERIGW